MSGAHPKVIQSVMRHSSITLTMDAYGHLAPGEEADAVARMRDLMVLADALKAPGTDDSTVEPGTGAARRTRNAATDDESGAARTRTWNQRIMSPLL